MNKPIIKPSNANKNFERICKIMPLIVESTALQFQAILTKTGIQEDSDIKEIADTWEKSVLNSSTPELQVNFIKEVKKHILRFTIKTTYSSTYIFDELRNSLIDEDDIPECLSNSVFLKIIHEVVGKFHNTKESLQIILNDYGIDLSVEDIIEMLPITSNQTLYEDAYNYVESMM